MNEKIRKLDLHEMGRRIRERRESLDISREILAEQLEVSPQFIADIEYGNKGLSLKRFYILCQVLAADPQRLPPVSYSLSHFTQIQLPYLFPHNSNLP